MRSVLKLDILKTAKDTQAKPNIELDLLLQRLGVELIKVNSKNLILLVTVKRIKQLIFRVF